MAGKRCRLTHAERAVLRKNIAAFVAANAGDVESAVVEFSCSRAYAEYACKCHNVQVSRPRPAPNARLRVIADLCNTDDTMAAVARRHGVRRQAVFQTYVDAVAAGIPVRQRGQRAAPAS